MTDYFPWLITLAYARRHRGLLITETGDDALISEFIAESSVEFINAIERVPLPYVDTKLIPPSSVYGLDLRLYDDLLAVTNIANANGEAVTTGYSLRPDNSYPKHTIELASSGAQLWAYVYREDRVEVAGVWGLVPHYATTAFSGSGISIPAAGLTDTATSLALTSGQGATFEIGQYIAVTTASAREVMQITAISTDTLTLSRAELGTTAAAHTAGDTMQIVSAMRDIQAAVRTIVVWKYLHKDQIGSRVLVPGGTVIVEDLDPQVQKTIERYQRQHFPLAIE
jgi:hypothetical protein